MIRKFEVGVWIGVILLVGAKGWVALDVGQPARPAARGHFCPGSQPTPSATLVPQTTSPPDRPSSPLDNSLALFMGGMINSSVSFFFLLASSFACSPSGGLTRRVTPSRAGHKRTHILVSDLRFLARAFKQTSHGAGTNCSERQRLTGLLMITPNGVSASSRRPVVIS